MVATSGVPQYAPAGTVTASGPEPVCLAPPRNRGSRSAGGRRRMPGRMSRPDSTGSGTPPATSKASMAPSLIARAACGISK
jgi:hypothetical protein